MPIALRRVGGSRWARADLPRRAMARKKEGDPGRELGRRSRPG